LWLAGLHQMVRKTEAEKMVILSHQFQMMTWSRRLPHAAAECKAKQPDSVRNAADLFRLQTVFVQNVGRHCPDIIFLY